MNNISQIKNKSLFKRIQEYKNNSTLNLSNYIIVEIDNKNIKTILENINENDFYNLYKELISNLSKRFQFQYIYFNKYKIICVLNEINMTYNGNINKLISNISSYITLTFNQIIYNFFLNYKKELESSNFKYISQDKINYLEKLEKTNFSYSSDLEIYSVPTINEVFNSIYFYLNENTYKSKVDFFNIKSNSKLKISISDIDKHLNNLYQETNYDWNNLHEFEKYGCSYKHKNGFKIIKNNLEFNNNNIDYILN